MYDIFLSKDLIIFNGNQMNQHSVYSRFAYVMDKKLIASCPKLFWFVQLLE